MGFVGEMGWSGCWSALLALSGPCGQKDCRMGWRSCLQGGGGDVACSAQGPKQGCWGTDPKCSCGRGEEQPLLLPTIHFESRVMECRLHWAVSVAVKGADSRGLGVTHLHRHGAGDTLQGSGAKDQVI